MLTRRRFLVTLPAAAAATHLAAQSLAAQSFAFPHLRKKEPVVAPPVYVYFGTDTDKGVSKGIYQSRFDPATGQLTAPVLAAATLRPAYLAMATRDGQRRLYAANEGNKASDTVSSYAVDPRSGALQGINQVSAAAPGPCYVAVDATGHVAFVADYAGATIASYHVLPGGGLSAPVQRIDFKDAQFGKHGPQPEQEAPHPHSVKISPDNRFLIVSDLGSDMLSVFAIDATSAEMGPPTHFSNDRPGSGPRHIAFHPNGRWVYSINELDSTIDHFLWTTTRSATAPQGLLVKTKNGIRTIADGFTEKNNAAEVTVSQDGRFVYASNRGEDTLVAFAVNAADGSLTLVQRIPCGGKTPRQFSLDPTGKWLVCGNQNSGTVTVFRRDETTGKLGGPVQTVPLDSPMMALFA